MPASGAVWPVLTSAQDTASCPPVSLEGPALGCSSPPGGTSSVLWPGAAWGRFGVSYCSMPHRRVTKGLTQEESWQGAGAEPSILPVSCSPKTLGQGEQRALSLPHLPCTLRCWMREGSPKGSSWAQPPCFPQPSLLRAHLVKSVTGSALHPARSGQQPRAQQCPCCSFPSPRDRGAQALMCGHRAGDRLCVLMRAWPGSSCL